MNSPPSSSLLAKATAWTRMSSCPTRSFHWANTRSMSSSFWTSQGSTKVEPSLAASGFTRFSMSISTEEKPTSAPSRWSAWAMPQAMEWSLAKPKIRARLPSSSPMCVLPPCDQPATPTADMLWRA